jgi:glycerol-3-phosphate cytidylyltransferase-like family protein
MNKRITQAIRNQLVDLGATKITTHKVEIVVMDQDPGFEDQADYSATKEAAQQAAELLGWRRSYLSGCGTRVLLRN